FGHIYRAPRAQGGTRVDASATSGAALPCPALPCPEYHHDGMIRDLNVDFWNSKSGSCSYWPALPDRDASAISFIEVAFRSCLPRP
ncbi:MAG: hypothetical protein P8M79_11475, partial [Alphaproteobacteria bacterium]|nr:hypothetical protein [Alphaproteobacteria bacterium]